jgi:hypothetical protein
MFCLRRLGESLCMYVRTRDTLHFIGTNACAINSAKNLAFLTQNKAKLCKKLIMPLVFEKNANLFARNCRKSQKIVITTSTPGQHAFWACAGDRDRKGRRMQKAKKVWLKRHCGKKRWNGTAEKSAVTVMPRKKRIFWFVAYDALAKNLDVANFVDKCAFL